VAKPRETKRRPLMPLRFSRQGHEPDLLARWKTWRRGLTKNTSSMISKCKRFVGLEGEGSKEIEGKGFTKTG